MQHRDHGFRSPFTSQIHFVSTTRFNDLKWGTRNPVIARDPELGPVRLCAFGTCSMRVTDPARFMTEIVGTDGEFTRDEIAFRIRNVIVQEFSRASAASNIPVLEMAANAGELGKLIARAIAPTIATHGPGISEFYIENIGLPQEVEKMLDKRTSLGIIGDLDRFRPIPARRGPDWGREWAPHWAWARRAIGGDAQRIERISTDHADETFKHVLLPIWTAAYRCNSQSCRFVVNGQSGRVQGERPWSM